jgi:hypothetical protein
MKTWHIAVCVGFMALGVVLVVAGAGAFVFLAPLGCAAMMAMMVWMMVPSRVKKKARGFASVIRRHQPVRH